MKKIILITYLLLFCNSTFAQKHEIGIFLGGANAIADIGSTNWVNPFPKWDSGGVAPSFIPIVFGFVYRYNLNPQQGLRFNLNYGAISGDNKNASENYRNTLSKSYENSILEFSTVFEYNFFPINAEQESAHSPYLFAGIGIFATNKDSYAFYKDDRNELKFKKEDNLKINYSIPFGIGYKYKFNWNWIIATEVGFRTTFIDYLDKGIVEQKDLSFIGKGFEDEREKIEIIKKHTAEIGDNRKNDWNVFTGLTLTYTFGRPACFCD